MPDSYLLYIDVLGFANLVATSPERVDRLFRTIDRLNVHRHQAFKVIAFSDTVLVYSPPPFKTDYDHSYTVMYACEFVQDLSHRLTGRGIFFRAVLCTGLFEHYRLENIECFYGPALIAAYQREKQIPAVGLFITDDCNRHNSIFPTAKFEPDLNFVFLYQSLERLQQITGGRLPTDPFLLTEADECPHLVYEVRALADMFRLSREEPDPRIRAKHVTTYDLFRARYPEILRTLEAASFEPEVICPSVDWASRKTRLESDLQWLGG